MADIAGICGPSGQLSDPMAPYGNP